MWEQQVGERIGQLRKSSNLSRAEFGKLIGVSEHYIGKIERGNHSITGATIAKICDITGASADYILFGSINPDDVSDALKGLSSAQIQVTLEIAMQVANFLNTRNGNNALIQEALRRQQQTDM